MDYKYKAKNNDVILAGGDQLHTIFSSCASINLEPYPIKYNEHVPGF